MSAASVPPPSASTPRPGGDYAPLDNSPTMVATDVTYCVTHGATDHARLAWRSCRFRQLFYFENPMDEHTLLWSDEIGGQS